MSSFSRSISIAPFKDAYQQELLAILDSKENPKAVYWDKNVIAPVNLIVGHSLLKDHGVSHSFIIDVQNLTNSPPDVKTIFFIIKSDLAIVDVVRNFLKIEFCTNAKNDKQYCILAIPSFSLVCRTFLQEMQVLDRLAAVYELPLTLLPLDTDLLSMEEPDCFAEFALKDKETSLFNLARGLTKFQSVFGLFPRIRAKGPKAKRVAAMLVQMRHAATTAASLGPCEAASQSLESPGQTDLLILIDRSVDVLTPCLSQLTYEGLINEFWQLKCNSVKLPIGSTQNTPTERRVIFNSTDQLFSEIRDQPFSNVGSILSKRTKELSGIINETKTSKELTTLKRVVGQLPELRQLHASAALHMNIAETLQSYACTDAFRNNLSAQQDFLSGNEADKAHPFIEQSILEMVPIEEVLRLVCVQSFCNGGLKSKLLDFYKREILQMYGFEHMLTLDNLERIGLLEECSNLSNLVNAPQNVHSETADRLSSDCVVKRTVAAISVAYPTNLRRSLRLQVPSDPTCLDGSLSLIFGGSIPISVRLVQAMTLGWPTRSLSAAVAPSSGSVGFHAFSSASNIASNAFHAGRKLVSAAGSLGGPHHLSSGGYVTSLLQTVEVDEIQIPGDLSENPASRGRSSGSFKTPTQSVRGDASRTVVVAFVGGITHSEITALRKIAQEDEGRVDFIFVTTGLITWKSFFRSLSEVIPVSTMTD